MPTANPQKKREQRRRWLAKNPDYMKNWLARNGRASREKTNRITRRRRQECIAAMGGCCCRCGFSDERALQFDHIVPVGGKKRGRRKKDRTNYLAILRDGVARAGFQLLCANCHSIKTVENGDNKFWLAPTAMPTVEIENGQLAQIAIF